MGDGTAKNQTQAVSHIIQSSDDGVDGEPSQIEHVPTYLGLLLGIVGFDDAESGGAIPTAEFKTSSAAS